MSVSSQTSEVVIIFFVYLSVMIRFVVSVLKKGCVVFRVLSRSHSGATLGSSNQMSRFTMIHYSKPKDIITHS